MNVGTSRGFTLLEVMVALAVLAVAVGAIIEAAGSSASYIGALRSRTLATWVASNKINEVLLERKWPEAGANSEGKVEMAGQKWRWELRISEVPSEEFKEDMRRLDVTVNLEEDGSPTVQLTAFKVRPKEGD